MGMIVILNRLLPIMLATARSVAPILIAAKETVISGRLVVKARRRLPTKPCPQPVAMAISSPIAANQIPAPMMKAADIAKMK